MATSKPGAGKQTNTEALSHCFTISFSTVVSSEELDYSLVFCPRQQSSSKDFHQGPGAAIHRPVRRDGALLAKQSRPHHGQHRAGIKQHLDNGGIKVLAACLTPEEAGFIDGRGAAEALYAEFCRPAGLQDFQPP